MLQLVLSSYCTCVTLSFAGSAVLVSTHSFMTALVRIKDAQDSSQLLVCIQDKAQCPCVLRAYLDVLTAS